METRAGQVSKFSVTLSLWAWPVVAIALACIVFHRAGSTDPCPRG